MTPELAASGRAPGEASEAIASILLVEDNPTLSRTTGQALRDAGYTVREASTAAECLSLIATESPNLVLLDVVLPDVSGIDLCLQIKSHPATAGVLVLLISGFRTTSDANVAGLDAGADGYIQRPIPHRELVARVQALLRLQQTQAALRQAREELEQRVRERTAELFAANERLTAEIAERRELEAKLVQSQKMQAVGQLAAGVAHDFNNILTVIKGSSVLLLEDAHLSPPSRECAEQIALAAERAAGLTRQLLLFTRQQIIRARVLDLNELISSLGKLLSRTLGEHITLRIHSAPQLPAVHADPVMIEQVIVNLAVNARDAMPQGGELTLRTEALTLEAPVKRQHPDARPGSFVRLSVTDTGCGIDSQTLPRIFEPFFTTKEVGKGTGLGLATVHGVVSQHEGWIEVQSAVGRGSTFSVFLPALPAGAGGPAPPIRPPAAGRGTETILLVEDEPRVRELAWRVLEHYGYHVLPAASGAEAFQVWTTAQHAIDLLLTDVVMPGGLTGVQLAERLQEEKPALKIVLASGYGFDTGIGASGCLRGARFLQKPYDPGTLTAAVRGCLDETGRSPERAEPD